MFFFIVRNQSDLMFTVLADFGQLPLVVLSDCVQSSPLDVCCIKRFCAIASTWLLWYILLYKNIVCNSFHWTFVVSEDFVQSSPLDFCYIRRFCAINPTRPLLYQNNFLQSLSLDFRCIRRFCAIFSTRLLRYQKILCNRFH